MSGTTRAVTPTRWRYTGKRAGGWTPDDVRYLEANPNISIKKLAAWLGRTEASVTQKRHELGIGKGRRWSEADTEFLHANPRMPVRDVARRLGKSENSVHAKRNALGIRSHDWTDGEDKIVRMWHNRLSAVEIAAKLPGRTAMAVGTRARQMDLHSDVFWKDKEVEFLKANPRMGIDEAARTLGRTPYAVHHMRRKLGMAHRQKRKKWTRDDKSILSDLTRGGATAKDIAAEMGRTKASIHLMQRKMGLKTPFSPRAMRPDDEKFLREHLDMPAVKIAKRLNRSPTVVRTWRYKMGLPRYQKHKRWTRDEIDLLKSNLQRPLSELYALFPDRSRASVLAKAYSMGRRRLSRKGHTYRHGYKRILQRGGKSAWEHRSVAEEAIGRPLRPEEVVHHINHIRHDNRPANLDVLENRSVHAKIPKSVNGLARVLLDSGAIGYDRGVHSYFLSSRSFDPARGRGAPTSRGRMPEMPYVFCGDRIFPFPLWPDVELADTLGDLPHANSLLPMDGRYAVALCGAAASPAILEDALGASASPFPVVKGSIADHDVVPVDGAAGAASLVRDTLKAHSGASATIWAALLDSRQLGAMDACAGRGTWCDLVEVLAPVKFGNGEGLSVAHSYVPRRGPSPVYGSRPVQGPPPQLSRVFLPFVRSRTGRRPS